MTLALSIALGIVAGIVLTAGVVVGVLMLLGIATIEIETPSHSDIPSNDAADSQGSAGSEVGLVSNHNGSDT